MKKLIGILLAITLLAGCAGWQITDSANNQAIAYASGKGVGLAINKYVPKADAPLSKAWGEMMVSNAGADPIPAEQFISFYQQAIVALGNESKDPYGLISDLTMFLAIYGGSIEYEATGGMQLVLAKPIPLVVAKAFELGYKSGRSAAQNFKVERRSL